MDIEKQHEVTEMLLKEIPGTDPLAVEARIEVFTIMKDNWHLAEDAAAKGNMDPDLAWTMWLDVCQKTVRFRIRRGGFNE